MPSILKVRDENGNFTDIPAIRGKDGKSAYEQAKEGGYKGTEQEFIALLNGLTSTDDADHYSDFDNPHKVTAEQTGAIPENYYVSADLNEELLNGSQKMIVCAYSEGTINTPFKEGLTLCSHGMVITNAYVPEYATQLCIPSGFSEIFIRSISGNIITAWRKAVDTEWRDNMYFELYENIYPLVNKIPDIEADVNQANEAIENMASMELLWENASPTSAFLAQTIAIDLSSYDGVLIIYKGGANWKYSSGIITRKYWEDIRFEASQDYYYRRSFRCSDEGFNAPDKGIIAKMYSGGSFDTVNEETGSKIVPLAIYGVKGVK